MKHTFKSLCLCAFTIATVSIPTVAGETYVKENVTGNASITVTLTGIKEIKGVITAGLYNSENTYKTGGTVRGVRVDVKTESVTFSYADLPAGEYAIKLFHDIDGDGEMDSNLFGIPTEPYAFSNNAVGRMGPAKWADAKFRVNDGVTAQSITLH